jgi:2-keto-3-deoxy-L-rhamnonate aldolase RhmA
MNKPNHLKYLIQSNQFFTGLFFKTPSPIIAEVLSHTDLDVIVLDGEHAPFDPLIADHCISIFRLAGKPVLTRPPSIRPEYIQYLLDSGSNGILAPHIYNAERARELVDACYYGSGKRGFSGATRAANFGQKTMQEHLTSSSQNIAVIAMLEDVGALENLEEILAVKGIDAFFIGRADLAASFGELSVLDPQTMTATSRILEAGKKKGIPIGMFSPTVEDAKYWKDQGAQFFLMGSDQAILIKGANALAAQLK